jgi:hypothetical protein
MMTNLGGGGRAATGKVFGIGFHKTGTTTLGQALEELGYTVCHGAGPVREVMGHRLMMERLHGRDLDPILDVAEQFQAFEDNPWFMLYPSLDRRFPGSRFILTVRDEQRWLESACRYYGQSVSDLRVWIYGVGSPAGREEVFRERYRRHNRDVLDYFAGRPDDLIVLDWEKGHGWSELSAFLGRPVPAGRFPHANPGRPPAVPFPNDR